MSACGALAPETSTATQPSSTLVAHQPSRQPSATANGEGVTIDLAVADPTSVLDEGLTADYALMGQGYNDSVVLGFPFFYGRKVFLNYGSQNASKGPAPYVAF